MDFKQRIQSDLKEAMKSKDVLRISVLRLVNTAIKNKEVEKRTRLAKTEHLEKLDELAQLTNEEIVTVIASEAKKRKDAILEFEKAERFDLVEKEKQELAILQSYLPEEMSEEEIRKRVLKTIKESGITSIKEIGKVMAMVMPQVKGRAEGALVQKIVKEELEKL